MTRATLAILALVLAVGTWNPTRATAVPILVNFSFHYIDPVLGNQLASGSFSFDSSSLPSGGGSVAPLTDPWSISFTFAGHTFTTSDAGLNLISDASGNLHLWSLYSVPNTFSFAPGFTLDGYISQTPEGPIFPLEVTYWTTPNPQFGSTTTGNWSESLPEPASLSVLGLGLPLLLLVRKRRR